MITFKDYLNEAKDKFIEYNGRNQKELESFITKYGGELNIESNGKATVIIDGQYKTIFKDDVISVKNGKINIKKPSYVSGNNK